MEELAHEKVLHLTHDTNNFENTYRVAHKSKPLLNYKLINSNKIRFLVSIKQQTSTLI